MSTKKIFERPGISIRLAAKKVDAKEDVSEIQIFKSGEFYHLYYGGFVLTKEIFQSMIKNFTERTYDVDLMIDYDHEVREAAAWIEELFLSEDGEELWARVKWTPEGQRCVADKEYRYISGDFSFNYIDSEKGLEYGPLLFGAALTNRPFLKGMAPTTELNELTGGLQMTLQELQAQNTKLADQVKAIQTEKDSEVKKLSDVVAAKDTEIKTLGEKVAQLEKGQVDAKKEQEFALLLADKKAVPAQKEAFLKGDMVEFAKLAGQLSEVPAGHGAAAEGGAEGDPDKDAKVMKLAEEKYATKQFATMGDAISAAMKEVK